MFQFPSTAEEWLQEAKLFEERWQFPNCLGSIDGKHVAIRPPPDSGSFFYNYKGFHSIVLMAIANANYEFLYVNVGTNGRISDGGVIENTDFYRKLKARALSLPKENPANGLPYVFISDEAFALRGDCLKPYNVKMLDDEKRVFNYRLSRARRVVENVFGILASRYGVLQSQIKLQPQHIDTVVLACCALHNFLRKESPGKYTPSDSLDREDPETHKIQDGLRVGESNIASMSRAQARNATEEAKLIRDRFKNYFNNEGRVEWQNEHLYG